MLEKPEVRLANLFKSLDARGNVTEAISSLFELYNDPKRAYHNLVHIIESVDELDRVNESKSACHPIFAPLIELALWYHDAVYDVRRKDNEEQSGNLLVENCLELSCLFVPALGYAYDLVIATKHSQQFVDMDRKIMVDIDLMRLGVEPDKFVEFSKAIAEEYSEKNSGYTFEQYRQGRIKFLQSMLARPRIYQTDCFYERYEQQARINLDSALQLLKTQ